MHTNTWIFVESKVKDTVWLTAVEEVPETSTTAASSHRGGMKVSTSFRNYWSSEVVLPLDMLQNRGTPLNSNYIVSFATACPCSCPRVWCLLFYYYEKYVCKIMNILLLQVLHHLHMLASRLAGNCKRNKLTYLRNACNRYLVEM